MNIQQGLFAMRDEKYRAFMARLVPNISADRIIGVRMPALREYAKQIRGSEGAERFLALLPHTYQEENLLHMLLLESYKDFEKAKEALHRFLPHVDNWAVCDCPPPLVFKKNREALIPWIKELLASGKTYSVRYGIGLLMRYFLADLFLPDYLEWVLAVREDDYYVRMMVAWYFATALTFRFEETLPYLSSRRLEPWIHAKTISKAIESYRISDDRKTLLRALR
jgi:3-methyladenine DNA glycosylase AlkD